MRAADLLVKKPINAYRKSINPPYSPKDLVTIAATLFILLVLPLTSLAIKNSRDSRSKAATTTFEGALTVLVQPNPDGAGGKNAYTLKVVNTAYNLLFTDGNPSNATTGATVRVSGDLSGDTLTLSGKDPNQFSVITAPKGGPLTPDSLGTQRTLMILVNFQNDRREPVTTAQAEAALADSDRELREMSYGKTSASGRAIGWITINRNADCRNDEITDAAIAILDSPQYNVDFAQYDRLLFMIPQQPRGSPGFCGTHAVYGKGDYPIDGGVWLGRMMFYLEGPEGEFSLMAEYLHTLGLAHANGWDCRPQILSTTCVNPAPDGYGGFTDQGYEYLGYGNGIVHFDPFQKEKLGWFNPGELVAVTTSGSYTIGPYESASTPIKAIKVPGYDPYRKAPIWYYLEYRQPIGLDADLFPDSFNNGVLVRIPGLDFAETYSHSLLLDMNPTNTNPPYGYDPLMIGQSYTDPVTQTKITVTGKTAAGINVTVDICKRWAPIVTVSPTIRYSDVGRTESYTMSVKNNDSAGCGSSNISLSGASPFGVNFGTPQFVMTPGQTISTSVQITAPMTIADGIQQITLKALNSASGLVGSAVAKFLITIGVGGDSDGDGFSDSRENYLGTGPTFKCPLDETHPAYPPDFDNNRQVRINDILAVVNHYYTGDPRYDLTGDGQIKIDDILMEVNFFFLDCTP